MPFRKHTTQLLFKWHLSYWGIYCFFLSICEIASFLCSVVGKVRKEGTAADCFFKIENIRIPSSIYVVCNQMWFPLYSNIFKMSQIEVKVKINSSLEQATKTQSSSRYIAIIFLQTGRKMVVGVQHHRNRKVQ